MKSFKVGEYDFNIYQEDNIEQTNFLETIKEQNDKTNYIKTLKNRVRMSSPKENFSFGTGYLIGKEKELIGYLWVGGVFDDSIYLEYLIEESKRKKGYGSGLLETVTDYIFGNYNIDKVYLDIDPSNIASIKTALRAGFFEEDYTEDKRLSFSKYNLNYIDKRKKGK